MSRPRLRWRLVDVLAFGLVSGVRTDLLDLEARRRLYEHVQAYPGLHLREIARAAGLEMNHAKYHLLYMQKHGLISSRRDEGYWRFFPKIEGSLGWQDQVPAEWKGMLALLRRPIPLHISLLLLDHGELNQSQIQERVGLAPSTLHYHLGNMEKVALLQSQRKGRERLCSLSQPDLVRDLLVRYRPPPSLVADFIEAWDQLDLDGPSTNHDLDALAAFAPGQDEASEGDLVDALVDPTAPEISPVAEGEVERVEPEIKVVHEERGGKE